MTDETVPTETLWIKRPLKESDKDFVLYTWIEAYRFSPDGLLMKAHSDREAQRRYWLGQERIAQKLVESCEVTVAESSVGDSKVIVGWICHEGDQIIHYVLSRRKFQRMGVAKDLLGPFMSTDRVLYSHRPSVKGLKLPENFSFDPFTALRWLGK